MHTTRIVHTRIPSFPEAPANRPLAARPDQTWQVLCGDGQHWRVGIYAPAEAAAAEIRELEQHDCPELFVLLSGRLTLLLADSEANRVRELPLEPGRPVLVTAPHAGFCPDGPHTGTALVVERDSFETEYRLVRRWLPGGGGDDGDGGDGGDGYGGDGGDGYGGEDDGRDDGGGASRTSG